MSEHAPPSTPNPPPPGEDLGPLETPKRGGATSLVVAGLVLLVLVGGLFYLDRKSSSGRMVEQGKEEFGFRAARLPEPPRQRVTAQALEPDPDRTILKATPQGVENQEAARVAQALAYAQQVQGQADLQANRERDANAQREAEARKKKEADRLRSPILVSSGDSNAGDDSASAGVATGDDYAASRVGDLFAAQSAANANGTPNSKQDERAYGFLPEGTSSAPMSIAGPTVDMSLRIRQGKIIPGVLKTAISSDHPGLVTAIVQEDVYSDDATQVLIPRGSDVIGEYRSGVQRGQSRVFVIWRRVIRPDGVDVGVESGGTDSLGVAGLTGDVDSHFFQRFGAAIILSFIEAQTQGQSEGTQVYGGDLQRTSEIALRDSVNIPSTINVDQGARINVLVARDLLFGGPAIVPVGLPLASAPVAYGQTPTRVAPTRFKNPYAD